MAAIVGRVRELAELDRLLDRAAAGSGGLLTLTGPAGSGRTTLLDEAAERARRQGFTVLRGSPPAGQPGRLVWAQLLRDLGAAEPLVRLLLDGPPGPLDLDRAARELVAGGPRLIVADDIDRGGPDALELLSVLAARVTGTSTAVLVTASGPLDTGPELRLSGLTAAELGTLLGDRPPGVLEALRVASHGWPGPALVLAAGLAADAGRPGWCRLPDSDAVVQLALAAPSAAGFLEVDIALVGLLERAVGRVTDPGTRARLLARLGYELLGDPSSLDRRRALIGEAVELAGACGDPRVLPEVLDARLHALWDPPVGEDRQAAAGRLVDVAREAGDGGRERRGLFWQFVSLMELGRITAAEAALAAYERAAEAAGDADGKLMAIQRRGMLAVLRGRFGDADRIAAEVAGLAARSRMADAGRLPGTLYGPLMYERDPAALRAAVDELAGAAERYPGHFVEVSQARIGLALGRVTEAGIELDRHLSRVLAGTGPRWLGAVCDLALISSVTGNTVAASKLYDVLLPYSGGYVIWGGANTSMGPVSHYLGLLAATLGRTGDALGHYADAIGLEESEGALPWLARTLAARAELTGAEDLERARSIAERLGMRVLLDQLAVPADVWTLRRDGDDWLLEAGPERARLRDGRGLGYLRLLVGTPYRDVSALDLVAGGAGVPAASDGPVLDAAAAAAYRSRLELLGAELDAADRAGDRDRATRLETEREALLGELRRSTGLGGRSRALPADAERARVNVTRTLRAALDRIAEVAPLCAAHLRASIRTGRDCRYDPGPGGPARWRTTV